MTFCFAFDTIGYQVDEESKAVLLFGFDLELFFLEGAMNLIITAIIASVDRFFNKTHFRRILEVSFYGASIPFSAGLAIMYGVNPLAIIFGRFLMSAIALWKSNWSSLTKNIFWACFFLALKYFVNPLCLVIGIALLGPAIGSAMGSLLFALLPAAGAIWKRDWESINPKTLRGFMNLTGFALVFLKVSETVYSFLIGDIGFYSVLGLFLIIVGVFSFFWYSIDLPTVLGKEIDGVKLTADTVVFVASIIAVIFVGALGLLWFIFQLLTGNFVAIGLVVIVAFILVSLWQGIICTIRFQRRFAEARDEKNCGIIRVSAFGLLMPADGVLLSFTLGAFSIINSAIMVALFTVVGVFVSSKEFDEA